MSDTLELNEVGTLLRAWVRLLVDDPAAVRVHQMMGHNACHFEVLIFDSREFARALGREGRYAGALRMVLRALSGRGDTRFEVEFVPPERHTGLSPDPSAYAGHDPDLEEVLRRLLEQTVRAMVDQPELVRVGKAVLEQSALFEVDVVPADARKVIGRHGSHIEALRHLVTAVGRKAGRMYFFVLLERMERIHPAESASLQS